MNAPTENPKAGDDVISPEGVEERIEYERAFRVTMTGGGKFRTYGRTIVGGWEPVRTYDTIAEAFADVAKGMRFHGDVIRAILAMDGAEELLKMIAAEAAKR